MLNTGGARGDTSSQNVINPPREYQKWIRSVRFTPRGFEKKELGRFDAFGTFRQNYASGLSKMDPRRPICPQRVRTQNSELGTQDSELRTQNSDLRAQDSGLGTQDSGLRTQNSGLRTQDSELRTEERKGFYAERFSRNV